MDHNKISTDVLVIGAGIAGISTALEAAETGYSVILLEKNPYIGGRVAQLNHYFPKLCPPTCGLEINIKRLRDNDLIKLYTLAELKEINGEPGKYDATVKLNPTYINENCIDIDKIAQDCSIEVSDEFNFGMNKKKAIYKPYNNAYPQRYVLDKNACSPEELKQLANSDAVDLNQKPETIHIEAKAVVWATGWEPYDAKNLETLGYNEYPEVITNMEMERLAAPNGPTGGKIDIPGSDKEIKKVVFVQCAGSRDENHLPYCSTICCLASMKHSRYIREQFPDAEVHIFYIDVRTHGIFEEFYWETQKDEKVFWHRGKVAKVVKNPANGQLVVEAEDTLSGDLKQMEADLVVLATGMKPNTSGIAQKELLDSYGFIKGSLETGMVGCGVCTRPKDVSGVVQESTAAALKAIHTIKGVK